MGGLTMNSFGKRLKRVETALRPTLQNGVLANSRMTQRALERISNEDFYALDAILEQGKQQSQWTEREASAAEAFFSAFEQVVQSAGYGNVREFQRSCGIVLGR
jgi:hypothetical protein